MILLNMRRLRDLLLLIGASLTFGGSAQAAPCASNCLAPGDYNLSMFSGGLLRTYLVHVPQSYDGTRPVSLLVDLHGFSSTADEERRVSGHLAQSDRRGFIAVWPQGVLLSWNGYGCCFVSNLVQVDDVTFLRSLIGGMKQRANIDASRVFVTGISNGGSMAQRMACEAADIVRAVAAVSFSLNSNQCRPSRPIGVTEIAGTADTTIPYDGGEGIPPLPTTTLGIPFGVQGARQSLAAWKGINGCGDALTRVQLPEGSRAETYESCNGGVRVGLVTIANGKHVLYNGYTGLGYDGNNTPIDVADYIWEHVFDL